MFLSITEQILVFDITNQSYKLFWKTTNAFQ